MTRILAVEDNRDTQLLLYYLLNTHFNLEIVAQVDEAMQAAAKSTFDAFVLDINLGEARSGVELLCMLRTLPQHEHTPALALTAYALPGDRERLLEAGFAGYVSKPFTRTDLLDGISQLLDA